MDFLDDAAGQHNGKPFPNVAWSGISEQTGERRFGKVGRRQSMFGGEALHEVIQQ